MQISVLINGDFALSADRTKLSNRSEAPVRHESFLKSLAEALENAKSLELNQLSTFGKLMERVDKDRRASHSGAIAAREE